MAQIIGRTEERRRLAEMVDALGDPTAEAQVLLVVGEPGSGKSTLLDEATERAAATDVVVLRARGSPTEYEIPYATLHQLVRPLLGRLAQLPQRQRAAVENALGLADGVTDPDALLVAVGVLTLLSDASAPGGMVVAVDDLHWADPASARVLELVAGRLRAERVAMLLFARPERPLPALARLDLEPLPAEEAEALLDAVGGIQPGQARARLLRLAEGNPLALVELARVSLPEETNEATLSLTTRLERAFAARTDDLPPRARQLLLLAAAAGEEDLGLVLELTAHAEDRDGLADWEPAERAGLVQLAPGLVRFRHPLVRSALYAAAPLAQRRAAHLKLAHLLADMPYRRAWHLAAAAPGRDEQAAAALEESAGLAQQRGGWIAAARWHERAAELSPRREDVVRRLLQAAQCALFAGHGRRVGELAQRVAAHQPSPAEATQAAFLRGWAMAQSLDHVGAVALLTTTAEEAVRAGAKEVALTALAPAGVAGYFAGDDAVLRRIDQAVASVGPSTAPQVVWARAVLDPVGRSVETAAHIAETVESAGGPDRLDLVTRNVLSGAAWIVDETPMAIGLMRAFLGAFEQPTTEGTHALVGNTLGSALFEAGRWEEAWEVLEWAERVAAETGMEVVGRAAVAARALISALRGQPETARALAAQATAGLAPETSRSVAVRARWSQGLAAAAEGDWEGAHSALRRLVVGGAPAHPHLALYALPDLVTAAIRTGWNEEAREVASLLANLTTGGSARLRILAAHARALTCSSGEAEAFFRAALDEALGSRWPVERARVAADYGTWLRRHRRSRDARAHLRDALETFSRVGARPLVDHARRELRAAGVRTPATADGVRDGSLADLTPQQRQIARLAAQGLTNREIGERLFLSSRTVGFHLYQVFPQLGVTSRMQLRDVLDGRQPVT